MEKIRLNKYIASTGAASRRGADELIKQGKVKVNGQAVIELGFCIDKDKDRVELDGTIINSVNKNSYVLFYKPKGCITTVKDDKGRKTIFDFIDLDIPHLFPVGRLDYDTEGLLLLTNDGDLAYKLTHPSSEIPKTYLVKVEGEVPEHKLAQLRKGIILDGVKTARAKVKVLEYKKGISKIEVTITEGKNRQVRRMFEYIEFEVKFLKRVAVGQLRLGGLARGGYRYLHDDEINYLKSL